MLKNLKEKVKNYFNLYQNAPRPELIIQIEEASTKVLVRLRSKNGFMTLHQWPDDEDGNISAESYVTSLRSIAGITTVIDIRPERTNDGPPLIIQEAAAETANNDDRTKKEWEDYDKQTHVPESEKSSL